MIMVIEGATKGAMRREKKRLDDIDCNGDDDDDDELLLVMTMKMVIEAKTMSLKGSERGSSTHSW